jgi:hypothetical protein
MSNQRLENASCYVAKAIETLDRDYESGVVRLLVELLSACQMTLERLVGGWQ